MKPISRHTWSVSTKETLHGIAFLTEIESTLLSRSERRLSARAVTLGPKVWQLVPHTTHEKFNAKTLGRKERCGKTLCVLAA